MKKFKISDVEIKTYGVISAPDTLSKTPSENKQIFDRLVKYGVAPKFNGLIDELNSENGASNIGSKNGTVQGHIDNTKNPHNVTAAQIGAYTKAETNAKINEKVFETGSADMTQAIYDPQGKRQDIFNTFQNPNLLINSNFKSPINSKNILIYTNTRGTVIDKWQSVSVNSKVELNNKGVKLSLNENVTSDKSGICQSIDNFDLFNQTSLTLSFFVNEFRGNYQYIRLRLAQENNDFLSHIKITVAKGLRKGTISIPANTKKVIVEYGVSNGHNGSTDYAILEWIKLEYGKVATPYIPQHYIEELQNCLMYDNGIIRPPYSNPNLLINGDFKIWQRGESFNTINKKQYVCDRWQISGDGNTEIRKENYGIRLVNTKVGTYHNFTQIIENNGYNGKTVTLSIKLNESADIRQIYLSHGNKGESNTGIKGFFNLTGDYHTFTLTLPNDLKERLNIGIQLPETNNATIKLQWIKLELGAVATPFVPRTYGEELALCQRYYCTNNNSSAPVTNVSMICDRGGFPYLTGSLVFPVTMRIVPTLTITKIRKNYDGSFVTLDNLENKWCSTNGISWLVGNFTPSLSVGSTYQIQYTADAEIY